METSMTFPVFAFLVKADLERVKRHESESNLEPYNQRSMALNPLGLLTGPELHKALRREKRNPGSMPFSATALMF